MQGRFVIFDKLYCHNVPFQPVIDNSLKQYYFRVELPSLWTSVA